MRTKGNTPYYGANCIQDFVQGYTHDGEFVLIAEDGANDLTNYPIHYVNGQIWVNNHAHVLRGKELVTDNLYLKNVLSQINFEPHLVGGSRTKLNANIMMNLNIKVTKNSKEQSKIGSLFKTLDNLITLHQRESLNQYWCFSLVQTIIS